MIEKERNRLRERELTSSRAPASVVAAVLVVCVCLYALFEVALKALGQPALLAAPETWWAAIENLPKTGDPTLLLTGGVLLLLLGIVFLLQGLLRGRRARHAIALGESVLIVDDQVIAASLARRARTEAGVAREQVLVVVSHARVEVQLRPTSGMPVDADQIRAAVEDELRTNLITPVPSVSVRVAETGVIGQ
ncbi:hypothetical protein [Paeniglutamicibacter cryotolerans]|uniref:Alkaline shock response membrane anchor protein AmaP n=1 Tax=Paeniglutamicibacter cryotolerans TaxID=670079 RepID=A0A839QG06_9MICC|nr:hypothetical protein [Paeniglutamicibacter cryotolerans]MBB2995089.1 hypothetical protein [Paeniglutamicibacter cryotolerans]